MFFTLKVALIEGFFLFFWRMEGRKLKSFHHTLDATVNRLEYIHAGCACSTSSCCMI